MNTHPMRMMLLMAAAVSLLLVRLDLTNCTPMLVHPLSRPLYESSTSIDEYASPRYTQPPPPPPPPAAVSPRTALAPQYPHSYHPGAVLSDPAQLPRLQPPSQLTAPFPPPIQQLYQCYMAQKQDCIQNMLEDTESLRPAQHGFSDRQLLTLLQFILRSRPNPFQESKDLVMWIKSAFNNRFFSMFAYNGCLVRLINQKLTQWETQESSSPSSSQDSPQGSPTLSLIDIRCRDLIRSVLPLLREWNRATEKLERQNVGTPVTSESLAHIIRLVEHLSDELSLLQDFDRQDSKRNLVDSIQNALFSVVFTSQIQERAVLDAMQHHVLTNNFLAIKSTPWPALDLSTEEAFQKLLINSLRFAANLTIFKYITNDLGLPLASYEHPSFLETAMIAAATGGRRAGLRDVDLVWLAQLGLQKEADLRPEHRYRRALMDAVYMHCLPLLDLLLANGYDAEVNEAARLAAYLRYDDFFERLTGQSIRYSWTENAQDWGKKRNPPTPLDDYLAEMNH